VKAVLKFNLPQEQSEHRLALDGWKWRSVVSDIADKLRSALKYDDDLTPETDARQAPRGQLRGHLPYRTVRRVRHRRH
jgi:hypothetical protein